MITDRLTPVVYLSQLDVAQIDGRVGCCPLAGERRCFDASREGRRGTKDQENRQQQRRYGNLLSHSSTRSLWLGAVTHRFLRRPPPTTVTLRRRCRGCDHR